MKVQIHMWDESGLDEWEMIEVQDREEIADEAEELCHSWAREGEWGDEGAYILTNWEAFILEDADDSGYTHTHIEPDHEALIRAAGGDPDCEHEWTFEGEGGLDENPGVWSCGGTTFVFDSHCRKCGLHKHFVDYGTQRNPGQANSWSYEQPEDWCPECQHEECVCE